MEPRFKPDVDPGKTLIDPEAFDASEEQFAASLESTRENALPKFIVDSEPEHSAKGQGIGGGDFQATHDIHKPTSSDADPLQQESQSEPESDSWRREVASKVSHYRSRRRPRAPHYPSLQLKFESSETHAAQGHVAPPANRLATALQVESPKSQPPVAPPEPSVTTEARGKILEFPQPPVAPSRRFDELADPVFDKPRIIEVPDVLPPPPAMGGILIEPSEDVSQERRPGFELPLQSAPMVQRVVAVGTDAVIVLAAFAGFAYTFFRMTALVPPLRLAAGVSAGLIFILWAGYQYLLLVYSGSTPGLKLAKLRLSRFDGSSVPQKLRRWRVIASVLSGLSLGLGFAWCFLDEDELCWHDRITRTYLAPRTEPAVRS